MTKQGKENYLKNISQQGIIHAFDKPFSNRKRGHYLIKLGVIMPLLPKPPTKLLDLRCGMGWTSCFFAKSGYDVIGQDTSADTIKYANKNKDREKLQNLEFIECDYEQMNLENEFDCAVFYDALHHSENEQDATKKTRRQGYICQVCNRESKDPYEGNNC